LRLALKFRRERLARGIPSFSTAPRKRQLVAAPFQRNGVMFNRCRGNDTKG